MSRLWSMMGLCGALWGASTQAAPLDALLSASQMVEPGQVALELSYDLVNSKVDFFNIRSNDTNYAGTNVGDYHGLHIRGGGMALPNLWLEGAYWSRRIDYRQDIAAINTWQIAGQYKLAEAVDWLPAVALRGSVWGNYAGELKKSSPSTASGITLNTVTVSHPKDVQIQADLIGTSRLTDNTELSLFGGAGLSQVSLDGVAGTASLAGCNYQVSFGDTAVTAKLAELCTASLVVDQFSIPNNTLGTDIKKESQYRAKYVQAGLMLRWHVGEWLVRGGYHFQHVNRKGIDDAIQSRGGLSYRDNHAFVGDVLWRLIPGTAVFVRGQYFSNQFSGEIPFLYNTLTASRFAKRYGILSTGLVIAF